MRAGAMPGRLVVVAVVGLFLAGGVAADGGVVNHLDVGIVPYMINTHYGGAKAEARVNLAPGSDTAGLYLTGGMGRGTWSDRIGAFIPWFSSDANYSKWKTRQKLYTDLGMAVTYKTTCVTGGLFWVNYDSDVHKHLNSTDFYAVGVSGSRMGGWLQLGYEIPIQRWLAGVAIGYRETREPVNVAVASSTGAVDHVTVRPVRGVYATVSLRFSLL
jgi:hypothetical protein